jgi:hypothetical protein
VEARIDEDVLELWKSLEVRRIQCIDLRLRLLQRGTGLQSCQVRNVVAVP